MLNMLNEAKQKTGYSERADIVRESTLFFLRKDAKRCRRSVKRHKKKEAKASL